jgi:hypothetical protein
MYFIIIILLLYWWHIVTFTKVLTISWLNASLHHPPILLCPPKLFFGVTGV